MLWVNTNREGFADEYAKARNTGMDALAESIVDIADTDPDPARARVRVDARKWIASKILPRKYGDRHVLSGDPEAPIQHSHSIDFSGLSRAEREAVRSILEARAPSDGDDK